MDALRKRARECSLSEAGDEGVVFSIIGKRFKVGTYIAFHSEQRKYGGARVCHRIQVKETDGPVHAFNTALLIDTMYRRDKSVGTHRFDLRWQDKSIECSFTVRPKSVSWNATYNEGWVDYEYSRFRKGAHLFDIEAGTVLNNNTGETIDIGDFNG